jgi:ubiquinone/menaquinone biosynthesis C-methylase UbiE
VVVAIFLLEHVLDLEQSLRETWRALRPGGTAVWLTTLTAPDSARHSSPRLSITHWRDFSAVPVEDIPWIVSLSALDDVLVDTGFAIGRLLGTRFRQGCGALQWSHLAPGRDTDWEQVLIEARKVNDDTH